MLQHQFLPEQNILEVVPKTPLQKKDFDELARVVDRHISRHGPLSGLLISSERFPGWQDFGALLPRARFAGNHHRDIRRVAAVSDDGFLGILPSIADHFARADVRHFPTDEKQKAIGWLRS